MTAKATAHRRTPHFAAFGLLCLLLTPLAAQADNVSASSAAGYARFSFTLGAGEKPTAAVSDGVLVLSFARKPGLTADQIAKALPAYISTARADADGKTFRFALTQPARLHTSVSGNQFALDLLPQGFSGTPPELPPPPPPEQKAVDVAALPVLKVRAGAYAHFSRLVFDFAKKTNYAVFPGAGRITIRFETKVRPDFSGLENVSPPWVKQAGWRIENNGTVIDFDTVSQSGYHDFLDGPHIVLDVLAPKTDAEAYNPPGTDAAAAKADIVKGKPELAAANAMSAAQKDAILKTAAKIDNKSPPPPKADGKPVPPAPTAAAAPPPPAAAAAPPPAEIKTTASSATLSFATTGGVAAFLRGRNAWVVLDATKPIDPAFLKTALGSYPDGIEVSNQGGVSILRIALKQEAQMAVRTDGAKTIVELAPKLAGTTATMIAIGRDDDIPGVAGIKALLPGAQHVVRLADPAAGDMLIVVPGVPGNLLAAPHRFVDFAALPSAAGLVIAPFADNLKISASNDAVHIGRPNGLSLTAANLPTAATPAALNVNAGGPAFLDFTAWAHPLRGSFLDTERNLREAAAHRPPNEANAARRKELQFYIANQFAAEALGVIGQMQQSDPALQDDVQLQAARAAADVMMGRGKDAVAALSGTAFVNDPHAALWRGLAYAQLEQWQPARTALARAMDVLRHYPPLWQARARIAYANAAIATGAFSTAEDVLAHLPKNPDKPLFLAAELARAQLFAGEGRYRAAAPLFAAVQKSGDEMLAANAIYDDTSAALAAGAIDQKEAISRLEKLRYRWRGDALELKTLRKLGAMYFGQQRWREGLGILRAAVRGFPHEESMRQAQDDMRAAFTALFLGGKADAMPPVQALGLFYDFIDLTPIGADGDEMIRRMSDRLVKVDLLGPAEDLLKYQVEKRLDGVAQAQVAARLAMIYLMDHKAKEALAALRATRIAGMPDAIAHDRLLLEARALAALKQYDQAVDLIAVDNAPDTRRLRADVYWESGNWAVAAQKAEEMLGEVWAAPAGLSANERREAMRAAIAYSLAGDDAGIARLRTHFGAKMAATPDASAFAVVTQSLDTQGVAFRDVAAKIASIDTLESFMTDFKKQFDAIPLVRGGG